MDFNAGARFPVTKILVGSNLGSLEIVYAYGAHGYLNTLESSSRYRNNQKANDSPEFDPYS